MSKTYKVQEVEDTNNFVYILIVFVLLLTCLPAIPISFCILFLLYLFKADSKKCMVISGGILIFTFIFFHSFFEEFLNSTIAKFTFNIQIIEAHNWSFLFDSYILKFYKIYTFESWCVLFIICFFVATIMLRKLDKNRKREQAGITNLDKEIKTIDKQNKSISDIKLPKEKTLLGYNQSGKKVFCDDNSKHLFISGTTGSGKTVTIANFIKSACQKNYGLLLVDGKGDTTETSMLEITKKLCNQYKRKLYVVDMNDPSNSIKFNPFKNSNPTVCKDMLINMSDWSEEHYKTNTERYLQRVIKMLLTANIDICFENIIKYINVNQFKELSSKLAQDKKISKDEHTQNINLIKDNEKIIQGAAARFSTLAEGEMGAIFENNGIDIYTALQENAVILFILNPLLYPETSRTLGRLILIDSKKAVSKLFANEKKRKFFVFDEINVYASSTLLDLINKSRSAGVTCICATQSLADLETNVSEAFREQIIENCNNYIIMRQNSSSSSETWAKTVGTHETFHMTYQVSDEPESSEKGSARRTREFIVHPDSIKQLKVGEGFFVSRDNNVCEKIKFKNLFEEK